MLTNKLADLKASHKLFGTGEDMAFHLIDNVIKMINFMEDKVDADRVKCRRIGSQYGS